MNVYKKMVLFTSSILLLLVTSSAIMSPVVALTLVWESEVSSSGEEVVSPILENGIIYLIVVEEIWWYNYPANLAADAQYYTTNNSDHWNWVNYFPAPDGHSFLQINGEDIDWGPFSNGDTGHTYRINLVGSGNPLTFKLVDWLNGYENNVCHLRIRIYKDVRVGGHLVESTPPEIDLSWVAGALTLAMVAMGPIIWYSRKNHRRIG